VSTKHTHRFVTEVTHEEVNCNVTVATPKDPGNSVGSPEGKAAIQAAEKAQADQSGQSGG
jgi:hypothetical protein